MGSAYEEIIGSDIFMFLVGPNDREYNVHGSAISRLSKPLCVLLNGDMSEAKEKCVKWPDVDEKTFVRFTQWAYTKTYVTEEPEIVLDATLIQPAIFPTVTKNVKGPEKLLYSLATAVQSQIEKESRCWNKSCASYNKTNPKSNHRATCLVCLNAYTTRACAGCNSVYTDCTSCGPMSSTRRVRCQYARCQYGYTSDSANSSQAICLRCRANYTTKKCACGSVFSDCGACAALSEGLASSKRCSLIRRFLDESGTAYPTSGSAFQPRTNTESCEDYTGVFLCHARLYVIADMYDIPSLKQLSLHRLHATLKEFNLYPSRMNDVSTLAKYLFENTVPQDKIRDMITLYYACVVEDAWKQDGLKSLIEEIPEFAFGLIGKMSDRLA